MAAPVPMAVWQVKSLINAHLVHTRPVGAVELLEAINFGLGKVRRALRSVRPQPQMAYVEHFTIPAGESEIDLSMISPPVARPVKLVMPSASGSTSVIYFRYDSSESAEFREAENSSPGSFTSVLYDMIEGMLPGPRVTVASATGTSVTIEFDQLPFPNGTLVRIPLYGPSVPVSAPPAINIQPTDYYGLVLNLIPGLTMNLSPGFSGPLGNPPAGTVVESVRRKVLRLVPALQTGVTGRLWYQYAKERVAQDTDLLEPNVAEHVDCLVYYALSALKLSVGDADTDRWMARAEALRSEMMQDVDMGSWGNTEHVGSDLYGVTDW